jgi:hypothetical protein
MSDQSQLPPEALAELLRKCRPEDFDGHTNFASLTPEQSLAWLDEAARFVAQFTGAVRTGKPSPTGS